jgi:coenzyme F420-reducing hydrogenase delta subunit
MLVETLETDRAPDVVAIVCENAPPSHLDELRRQGAVVHPVKCTGNLHTSAVELALRGGAAGVIIFSCPPRDCRGREGPKWLEQRMYHDREAELPARVDRRRVRLATAAPGELAGTMASFEEFRREVRFIAPAAVALDELNVEREPTPVVTGRGRR